MDENWTGYGNAAPFWPNFATGMDVEIEFDTRINVSRDGTEQRIGWLPYPRTAVEFDSWTRLGKLAALFDLRQTPNSKSVLPYFYRSVQLSAAASTGGTLLALTGAVPPWVSVGTRLVLHGDGKDEGVVVSATGSGNLTISPGLASDWPAGTRAYLAREAYRAGKPSFQLVNRRMGLAQKPRFEFVGEAPVSPRTSAIRTHTSPGYETLELFDFKANWASPLELREDPYLEEVVSRRGVRNVYAPHEDYDYNRQEQHLLKTAEEIEQFSDFFMRHYGRQKKFFARTYAPKLTLDTVVYPDEPGPTGLDASELEYYPDLYPFKTSGPDLFELTSVSTGEAQLVDRMSIYAGNRELTVPFPTGVFGSDPAVIQIETPIGPSRAHIEAGLVTLSFAVFCSYVDGESTSGDPSSPATLQFEIVFDHGQTEDNRERWDGTTRVKGQADVTYDYGATQGTDGDGVLIDSTVNIAVPIDAWFVTIDLYLQPNGTTDDIVTKESRFTLSWSDLPGDYDIFETYQPVTIPTPVVAEPYGVYRFDQDRLTVSLRTGSVAESTVTLRSLNENPDGV